MTCHMVPCHLVTSYKQHITWKRDGNEERLRTLAKVCGKKGRESAKAVENLQTQSEGCACAELRRTREACDLYVAQNGDA